MIYTHGEMTRIVFNFCKANPSTSAAIMCNGTLIYSLANVTAIDLLRICGVGFKISLTNSIHSSIYSIIWIDCVSHDELTITQNNMRRLRKNEKK